MGCPVCIIGSIMGGYVGANFFGVDSPKTRNGKILSCLLSSAFVTLTLFALKNFYHFPLCGGVQSIAAKVVIVMTKSVLLSTVYAIPINLILSKFVYSSAQPS